MFAFRRVWIKAVSSGLRNVFLMNVMGDSMLPIIDDGDIVLVDSGKRRIWPRYIYAIGYGDTIMVKRLELSASGVVRIISDNKDLYPPDPSTLRSYGSSGRSYGWGRPWSPSTPSIILIKIDIDGGTGSGLLWERYTIYYVLGGDYESV